MNTTVICTDLVCKMCVYSIHLLNYTMTEYGTLTGSGTVPCNVTVSSGTSTQALINGYTYSSSQTPTITGVFPARGGTGGGATITVNGTKFG